MYFDEDLVLELRFNLLDKYVDYFVIVESKYNHKGEPKKLNFNIKNFKKFEKKIIYLIFDQEPSDLYKFEKQDTQADISSKYIFNAGKRENGQRNFISQGLKEASPEDIIIISDVDEIPNLVDIDFNIIKNEIIIFRQDMFYYKFNLSIPCFKWTGTKACKYKNLVKPQWLRNIKDRKYPFYRLDTLLSKTKYGNVKIINDGGWHFSNIKTAKEIEYKLRSYLHHREFDLQALTVKQIENTILNKMAIYDLSVDKNVNKVGSGKKLENFDKKKLPTYLQDNLKTYSKWID